MKDAQRFAVPSDSHNTNPSQAGRKLIQVHIIDNTSEPYEAEGFKLTADVNNIGEGKSYQTIDPADQHYADQVKALHPIWDTPGIVNVPKGRTFARPGLEALDPVMRKEVRTRMAGLSPEQAAASEADFVEAALKAKIPELRMVTGLGDDALPYQREMVSIARDMRDIEREFMRLSEELDEVRSYGVEFDPETGKNRPKEVLAVQGQRRRAMEDQRRELMSRLAMLNEGGHEAQRRLAQALGESVAILKERDRQAAEERDARALGAEKARKARVEAKAELYARLDPHAPSNK